jgi:hypothetical protein
MILIHPKKVMKIYKYVNTVMVRIRRTSLNLSTMILFFLAMSNGVGIGIGVGIGTGTGSVINFFSLAKMYYLITMRNCVMITWVFAW